MRVKSFLIILLLLPLPLPVLSLQDVTFISEEYPPFNYSDSEGHFTGMAVEILQLMFDELNIKKNASDIQVFPWARGYALAQAPGQMNALFTTARLKKRENKFKWVGPYTGFEVTVFSKNKAKYQISEKSDLGKYHFVIVRQDLSETLLIEAGVPQKHISLVANVEEAIDKVLKERADCFAHSSKTLHKTLNKMGLKKEQFKSLYDIIGPKSYFAFNKSVDDKTVKAYQSAFDKVTINPDIFDKLYNKHIH